MIFREADASRPQLGITILRCCSLVKCIIYKILSGRQDIVLRNPFDRTYNPRQPRYADGKFIKRIQQSRICHSDRELREVVAKNRYDAFIVGSDQVWRQEYSPRIETYFLDFYQTATTERRWPMLRRLVWTQSISMRIRCRNARLCCLVLMQSQ